MVSTLAFFVLICVLVFVHEYGHFWAARKCGVRVIRFSIGFGKVLWRKKDKYGTEFAFSLIPLGGYVQMYQGEPEFDGEKHHAFSEKSGWQRAFIILAGPVANFIFAVLAYWAVFVAGVPTVKPVVGEVVPNTIAAQAELKPELEITRVAGREVQDWEEVLSALIGNVGNSDVKLEGYLKGETALVDFSLDLTAWHIDGTKQNPLTVLGIRPKGATVEPVIKSVVEDSAAHRAGIQAGDRILKVNRQPFEWQALLAEVQKGEAVSLDIERDGSVKQVVLQPQKSVKEGRYLIGIQPTYQPLPPEYRTELKYGILTAFEKAGQKVGSLIYTTLQFIGKLLSGDLSLKNMSGPISMAKGAGVMAESGWIYYLGFMALISVNLGVMNLFPILPLDGGQLLLLGAEGITGKPLSERFRLLFQQAGFLFVVGLMLFALFNDLIQF